MQMLPTSVRENSRDLKFGKFGLGGLSKLKNKLKLV